MVKSMYRQFMITSPEHLATQTNTTREEDGLDISNFIREAAQALVFQPGEDNNK